jgi:hypothetical protein
MKSQKHSPKVWLFASVILSTLSWAEGISAQPWRLPIGIGGTSQRAAGFSPGATNDIIIRTNESCESLQQKLDEAHSLWAQDAGRSPKRVYLTGGVSIDCSDFPFLEIQEGVTLASNRDSLHPGAIIFSDTPKNPLILPRGNHIRITGLRIRGSRLDRASESAPTNKGIVIQSREDIEIDHNELSGWNTIAIDVRDSEHRINKEDIDRVNIHHNYIHHNQTKKRDGYGVALHNEAYARIAYNVFDHNRHAIAGDGSARSGYRAWFNLVLPGGGFHGEYAGYDRYTHQFDMHGQRSLYCTAFVCQCSSKDPGWAWKRVAHKKCGRAGEFIDIQHNTFQYTRDAAFMLRGTPAEKAYVWNNSFRHAEEKDALDQTESGLDSRGNLFGIDTRRKLAACDFDGDGKDDIFQATGRSWYFSSAGKREYMHLKYSQTRLEGLAFGDFDGDGKCDVFTKSRDRWMVSRGGTEDWSQLNTFDVSDASFDELGFGDFDGDGKTDVFHADGTFWYVSLGGTTDWKARDPWNRSSYTVDRVRFGDFDGNGTTDVFSLALGGWSVSYGGATTWQKLNDRLSSNLKEMVFADYDGNGRTDILTDDVTCRPDVRGSSRCLGDWLISRDASGELEPVKSYRVDIDYTPDELVWGSFDGSRGADGLYLDSDRRFRIANRTAERAMLHSLYSM